MQKQIPFQLRMDQNLTELNPVLTGEARNYDSDGETLLETRENCLLHYIRCGKGELHYKGQTYPLRSGQIIVLPQGATARFHPLPGTHWALRWVAFNGTLAHRFAELPPVIDAPAGTFETLCDLNDTSKYQLAYRLASELFFLYSVLLPPPKQKVLTDTVDWILDYVKKNYMNPITVAAIAADLGLDPDYLTRKFKKKTNMNIQSYILQTRLTNAKRYLIMGYSVKEVASMCGFNDASGFCRAFKKYENSNQSPSHWQARMIELHRLRKSGAQQP